MVKFDKQFSIAVLWAVIAIVIAAFFFFRREKKAIVAVNPARVRQDHSSGISKSDRFALITLNDILFQNDSIELISENVHTFRRFAEYAAKYTKGLVLVLTITGGSHTTEEAIKSKVEKMLQISGISDSDFKLHRIVYTSNVESRISVGRQIEPEVFLDSDPHVVTELTGKIPSVFFVGRETFKSFVTESLLKKVPG